MASTYLQHGSNMARTWWLVASKESKEEGVGVRAFGSLERAQRTNINISPKLIPKSEENEAFAVFIIPPK